MVIDPTRGAAMKIARRVGYVSVALKTLYKNPEALARVFTYLKAVPLSIDDDAGKRNYKVLSERFREIKKGGAVPKYLVSVTETAPIADPNLGAGKINTNKPTFKFSVQEIVEEK